MLARIEIRNYRAFGCFSLVFRDGLNVIVGDNDSGKTTLLEAVSLALTGRLADKPVQFSLSPHLFNQAASASYIGALEKGERPVPPEIIIDLFLDGGDEYALLRGTNNLQNEDAPGLRVRACFDERFAEQAPETSLRPATRPGRRLPRTRLAHRPDHSARPRPSTRTLVRTNPRGHQGLIRQLLRRRMRLLDGDRIAASSIN